MMKMQLLIGKLTDGSMVTTLIELMEAHCDDFPECRQKYLAAVERLGRELGEKYSDQVTAVTEAVEKRIASDMICAGYLGFQANLQNFVDPSAKCFLEVDPEVYLCERTAHSLPAYARAQRTLSAFGNLLSEKQQDDYVDIIEYCCYLETIGPKLAHYYGYYFANQFLCYIEPGYVPDGVQTNRYTQMLSDIVGENVLDAVVKSMS